MRIRIQLLKMMRILMARQEEDEKETVPAHGLYRPYRTVLKRYDEETKKEF
jgi:hypothetical protein